MRLILIRHAQTPANVTHTMHTTVPGPGLTALGRRQVAALPLALADTKVEALYASTHRRTQLTAAPLAAESGLEIRVRAGIREISAGSWEGRSDEAAHTEFLETVFGWATNPYTRLPGGERGIEVLERFDAVVAEAAGTGLALVAMVSHGAVIRVWLAARAANIDAQYAMQNELDNTSSVLVDGTPENGWRVTSWAGRQVATDTHTELMDS